MRLFQLLVLGATLAFASMSWAQSSPAPGNTSGQAADAQTAASESAPSPSATVSVEPPSLIPPNILPAPGRLPQIPTGPDLQQLNAFFKQTSLGKAANEQRLHSQMAALETRIRNDEELHALRASAQSEPTDLEKRHGLKTYYHVYFKKLHAFPATPELKTYLDAQEATHVASLLQPRTRHETDEAEGMALNRVIAAAGVPTPSPKPAHERASAALLNP